VEQRAILASYESAKKAEDNARAHEEADEELHHALNIFVQQHRRRSGPLLVRGGAVPPPQGRGGMTSAFRGNPKGAVEKWKREGGGDEAGPSSTLKDAK
jgi:hypothetical protein